MNLSNFKQISKGLFLSILGMALYFFLLIVLNIINKNVSTNNIYLPILQILIFLGGILLFVFFKNRIIHKKILCRLKFKNLLDFVKYFGIYFLTSIVVYLFFDYFLYNDNNINKIIKLLFSVSLVNELLAPIMEEVVFRYFILVVLVFYTRTQNLSALMCSILFALLHIFQYNLWVLIFIILIGLAFSYLYLLTNNIGASIGLHFAINFHASLINDEDNLETYQPNSLIEVIKDNAIVSIIVLVVLSYWFYFQLKLKKKIVK